MYEDGINGNRQINIRTQWLSNLNPGLIPKLVSELKEACDVGHSVGCAALFVHFKILIIKSMTSVNLGIVTSE